MKKWHYPFLAFLIIGTIVILTQSRNSVKPEYRTNEGLVFGTSYHITYLHNADLKADIEQTLLALGPAQPEVPGIAPHALPERPLRFQIVGISPRLGRQ